MSPEIVDVVIIGAGLTGLGAAVHVQRECPRQQVVVLEARAAMRGTWDLFRYPGIRSDADIFTLGYNFKPWPHLKSIADGADRYLPLHPRDGGRVRHRPQDPLPAQGHEPGLVQPQGALGGHGAARG